MLELKNISFSVGDENNRQEKGILKKVSLTVDTDSFVVITGPNGGGKSTLAKIIMGIEQPTEGKILFKGQDITNFDVHQRAQLGIGFAFQQPVRFKGLTVKDLLRLATHKDMSSAPTFPKWGCVRRTISTGRSTPAFPAANSNALKLPC